jgi:hypothetical protein
LVWVRRPVENSDDSNNMPFVRISILEYGGNPTLITFVYGLLSRILRLLEESHSVSFQTLYKRITECKSPGIPGGERN